jgi:hypothetical protein
MQELGRDHPTTARHNGHAAKPTSPRLTIANLAACAALLLASVLSRLPALLNARGVHSDAAVIGLQARHLLRGEWSWFIWGTNYQGITDAAVVALGFRLGGASALMLMLVPLLGHLILVGLTFATLRRHLAPLLAAGATLPVVFTPQAVNGVALYAPRQWAITLVIAAVWLLDGAGDARRPLPRYAFGAALGGFALYCDLFAVQFLPALGCFALACCVDRAPTRARAVKRAAACGAGFLGGLALVALSRLAATPSPNSVRGGALSFEQVRRNAALLWDQCLPWLLGYGVYIPGAGLYPDRWMPPAPIALVQIVGALLFVAGLAWGGVALLIGRGPGASRGGVVTRWFARRQPWPVYRLGAFGAIVAATTLGGFLVSSSPYDMWAARYLAPTIWAAPFALVPAAQILGARRFLPALAPYIVAAALGGWLSFGPYVRGPLPVADPRGQAAEEEALGAALRARGVTHGAAQFWLAYRLTFLWGESPTIVPLNPATDRYYPYRHAYEEAPIVAYIFDEGDPRATAAPCLTSLQAGGGRYEVVTVAPLTALVSWRGAAEPDPPGCAAAIPQQSAPSAKK